MLPVGVECWILLAQGVGQTAAAGGVGCFLEYAKPKEENPSFYAALYEFIAKLTAKRLKATSEVLSKLDRELRELKGEAG